MGVRYLGLIAGLAGLAVPGAARGADPIMPLSEVRPGMQCTGLSVFKGQAVESFGVEILDIVGQATIGRQQPRLLVRVSGENIEPSGVAQGFSGSPVYCTGEDGVVKNAGAISESLGEFGDRTVLATPIEQVLATTVTPPRAPKPATPGEARLLARARPLTPPLAIGGLSAPLRRPLLAAAQRRGVALLQAPSVPADAAPEVPFVPGSAVGVGYSSGDVTLSGVGTVTYVDGDRLWAYGHGFEAAGARSLLLQDAYVATIISSPISAAFPSYKLAGAVRDRGTITNDGFDAVAGRLGALPERTDVRVVARDTDVGARRVLNVDVASEADLDNPTGFTALSFAGPLAVSEAATTVLNSAPQRIAGRMCLRVRLRELKDPLRFCNRYVSDGTGFGESLFINPVALAAGSDAATALGVFDAFKGKPVHVTDVDARITQTRAQRQAYIRNVTLPKRIRRGATVGVKLVARVVRGPVRVFNFDWKVPGRLKAGKQRLDFRGADPESGFGFFFDELIIEFGGGGFFDSEGLRTVEQVGRAFEATKRYDGVRLKGAGRVFRDETFRIGGRDRVRVQVLKRR